MGKCTSSTFRNSDQITFAMYKNHIKVMFKIFDLLSSCQKYLSSGIYVNHKQCFMNEFGNPSRYSFCKILFSSPKRYT